MGKKSPYRIRNWIEYNSSLKQLGSGAIWVSSEATAKATLDIVSVVDKDSPNKGSTAFLTTLSQFWEIR